MRKVIIILAFIPLMVWADTPDSTKVDSVKVDTVFVGRSYNHVQKKMDVQTARLDSIIMKLQNDTIKK